MLAVLDALLLVSWANSAPLTASLLLGDRWTSPVDGGAVFYDARPWLGSSKTWRGWLASALTTPFLAVILGLSWELGLAVALGAMLGDSAASFIKRRLGYRSSESCFLLDQVPESLIPALVLRAPLGLTSIDLALVASGFLIIDLSLTPVARWLKRALRDSI